MDTDLSLKSGRQRLREEGMSKLLPLLRRRSLHPEASPLDPRSAWISSFKQLTRQENEIHTWQSGTPSFRESNL